MKKTPKEPTKDTPEETLAKTVTPKPSKREVIEAMALLQHTKMVESQKEEEKKFAALHAEVVAEIRTYIRQNVAVLPDVSLECHIGWSKPEVHIELLNAPASIKRKIEVISSRSVLRVPELSEIRRQIRARMSSETTDERVTKLVNDPASKAALEDMLAMLNRAATPALPAPASK